MSSKKSYNFSKNEQILTISLIGEIRDSRIELLLLLLLLLLVLLLLL